MAIEEWRKCREVVQRGGYLQNKQITPLCYLFLCELALAAWEGEKKVVMNMERASELLGCNPQTIMILRKKIAGRRIARSREGISAQIQQ